MRAFCIFEKLLPEFDCLVLAKKMSSSRKITMPITFNRHRISCDIVTRDLNIFFTNVLLRLNILFSSYIDGFVSMTLSPDVLFWSKDITVL